MTGILEILSRRKMDMKAEDDPSISKKASEQFQSDPEYRAKVVKRAQAIKKRREEAKRGKTLTPEEAEHLERRGRASKWAR
jgi:hypothetical protein